MLVRVLGASFRSAPPDRSGTNGIRMTAAKTARVSTIPDLIFKKTARNERLPPNGFGQHSTFREKMGKRDGAVEVDHRSSRSDSISFSRSRSFIIGVRGGGPAGTTTGGVTQPSRTPSARRASVKTVLRPACGGPNSATTRSRSVTNTISPPAAIRTYSLSLFLSTLRPTERTAHRSFQKLPWQFCGSSCQLVSRTADLVEWSGQAPLTRTDNLLRSPEFAAGGQDEGMTFTA